MQSDSVSSEQVVRSNAPLQAEIVQEAVDKVREKCIIECQRIVSVYQMIECKNWK